MKSNFCKVAGGDDSVSGGHQSGHYEDIKLNSNWIQWNPDLGGAIEFAEMSRLK